jgi:hypothetical protein
MIHVYETEMELKSGLRFDVDDDESESKSPSQRAQDTKKNGGSSHKKPGFGNSHPDFGDSHKKPSQGFSESRQGHKKSGRYGSEFRTPEKPRSGRVEKRQSARSLRDDDLFGGLRGSSAARLSESDRYLCQRELKSKAAALEAEAESIRDELAELEEADHDADHDADERERRNYGDDRYDRNRLATT